MLKITPKMAAVNDAMSKASLAPVHLMRSPMIALFSVLYKWMVDVETRLQKIESERQDHG